MTTYIADGYGAGCDSLWSDQSGNALNSIPIRKYILFDGGIRHGRLSHQTLVLYSGTFYALLNHQAYYLNLIEKDDYANNVKNLVSLNWNLISLVELDIELYPLHVKTMIDPKLDWGIYYGGSGGHFAAGVYAKNHTVRQSIQHAIDLDPFSGPEINALEFAADGELDLQGFDALTDDMCVTIKEEVELMGSRLPLEAQAATAEGGSMKYAGCTTSPAPEARPVSAKEMLEFEEKRRRKMKMLVTPEGSVRRKRIIRRVSSA